MRKLRAGVVGAGAFGRIHARKYAEDARVQFVGVFDPDDERAQQLADTHGATSFATLDALIAAVDVVTIASPPSFHAANAHPALVFMGDTGALALGSSLAVVALMTGQWLLLPVIGIVFVIEALSNIIQIAYFRATGGKRFFKRAPFHMHLEMSGWAETQIVTRAWLVGIAAAMLGVALALAVPE